MITIVALLPLLLDSSIIIEPDDGLGSADWINEVHVWIEDGYLNITAEIAIACNECETEWRLGLKSIDNPSQNNPIWMLSHTMDSLWIDDSLAWAYPTHSSDPINFNEQSYVEHFGTSIQYTIPLMELPESMWHGASVGLLTMSADGQDWFGSQWSDDLILDIDGDGLSESEEAQYGTNNTDADSDDDGLLDGPEIWIETDPLMCDTDGDTLSDGLERGVTNPPSDTDRTNECFVGDRQPSTKTNPLLQDSDGGGVSDNIEDVNGDGRVDIWETDPNDTTDDLDTDNDGIADAIEDRCLNGFSEDADGDGLSDIFEGWVDTDDDGTPDFCDEDDDNDGRPTSEEGDGDYDNDGLINAHDPDSDNDGIPDGEESVHDKDCDGIESWLDDNPNDGPCSDSDMDGLTNEDEEICGTDPYNPDTDNDGILDSDDCPNIDLDDWTRPDSENSGPKWTTGCSGFGFLPLILLIRRRRFPSQR